MNMKRLPFATCKTTWKYFLFIDFSCYIFLHIYSSINWTNIINYFSCLKMIHIFLSVKIASRANTTMFILTSWVQKRGANLDIFWWSSSGLVAQHTTQNIQQTAAETVLAWCLHDLVHQLSCKLWDLKRND